ncbi:extracellular calcium-sensing receptor-like isoform X1 [Anguilla anguilla]|uniref:extracellular calcium-sensing receptor-like isoform X1 n=1 Tax=Anguilla anguilla TaxID=7936 RepID=UPI0015B08AA7|nr:extracellular calcium-sensing receptor-like isoform X1 [Anguilla anguilla]
MGVRTWLWLWVLLVLGAVCGLAESSCQLLETLTSQSLYKEGDVIIGGLFPVHLQPPEPSLDFTQRAALLQCQNFYLRGYRWLQTMIFAVEEINRNPQLLPNLTLGYALADTCLADKTTISAALGLVTGKDPVVNPSSSRCGRTPKVPVIVGDARSSTSIMIADTLGVFNIPMVSYFATCACLGDRQKYPTFFRTVPSDAFQARAMARMLRLFGWTWVGVVMGDDDYSKSGIQLLLEELQNSQVCVAFSEVIPKVNLEKSIPRIVAMLRQSTAKVIITFAIATDMHVLLSEVLRQNITNKQWIATESWITASFISSPENLASMSGTIGFALRKGNLQGLRSFLTRFQPKDLPSDPFLQEFWEVIFGCSWKNDPSPSLSAMPHCTGYESLDNIENIYTDVSQLRATYSVYKAVYAIAHAIHNMLSCQPGDGPFENGGCPDVTNLQPWQILHYLHTVNFTTPVGEATHFDENGEPPAAYDIINWQVGAHGTLEFVRVGQFDSVDGSHSEFDIDVKRVVWGGGQKEVPMSVCSMPCPPGTRKAVQKGKPICCFDCLPCAEGEISNTTGSTECQKCPDRFWSNAARTTCIPKEVEFLSFQEIMGIILAALSVSGVVLTTSVLATFFFHRDTPLVRANNAELSFLLLLSLSLCFLCALAFIGRPTPWSCMLRHTLFGISFVLCISCVLSRTVVVLVAFRASVPGSNIMRYFGPVQQRLAISLCTSVQVLICVLWLVLSPPIPAEVQGRSARIILECDVGSGAGFACVLGYIGLLAAICFLLAFLARKLPDNFNEAKFITFSMLIFCAVWITFIPAYVSSPGKYTVAVEIFAILASSYGLLLCIFAPKCYIILLRPDKNTKKKMMAK